jgi:hypothetical protein
LSYKIVITKQRLIFLQHFSLIASLTDSEQVEIYNAGRRIANRYNRLSRSGCLCGWLNVAPQRNDNARNSHFAGMVKFSDATDPFECTTMAYR